MMSAAFADVGESGNDMNCSSRVFDAGAGLSDIEALTCHVTAVSLCLLCSQKAVTPSTCLWLYGILSLSGRGCDAFQDRLF